MNLMRMRTVYTWFVINICVISLICIRDINVNGWDHFHLCLISVLFRSALSVCLAMYWILLFHAVEFLLIFSWGLNNYFWFIKFISRGASYRYYLFYVVFLISWHRKSFQCILLLRLSMVSKPMLVNVLQCYLEMVFQCLVFVANYVSYCYFPTVHFVLLSYTLLITTVSREIFRRSNCKIE